MENIPCIEISDVNYTYNDHPVLENISFDIQSGEYLGIIGPNGGGKSTLLRIILGLLQPDEGRVKIFGQEISHLKDKHLIGYVPQRAAHEEFYFPASVEEIVRSGRTARLGVLKRPDNNDKQAIREAMEVADITSFRKQMIAELSGGQRQRVFIARALAGDPKVLILDEPVVGVDIASKDRFYAFLKHLNHDMNITIVFVSHDVGAIANEVTAVLCLNRGLICHGHPQQYMKEDFLEKVYGSKVKSVFHEH